MPEETFYPRFLGPRILEALADSPVVLIHGPRRCGKTALARLLGDEAGFAYFTFDDDVQRASAKADPVGYVADLPERAVLDEVQRVGFIIPDFPARGASVLAQQPDETSDQDAQAAYRGYGFGLCLAGNEQ